MTQTSQPVTGQCAAPVVSMSSSHVGPWELVRLIGTGALTRVYQARPADGRRDGPACYAVKVLTEAWEDNVGAIGLLRAEARVGRKVSHPHVVSILASSVQEPPYYVAMPLLPGATLDARLRGSERLEVPFALWIARQAAEGLAALAARGLMHADVKPSNLFLAGDGHVTLIDLGFARPADSGGGVGDRPVVGTISYMAPEMITSALAADARSDIYSLGVVLYEMLAGRLPFEGRDAAEVAVMHRQAVPEPLKKHTPQLSTPVAHLVHQMLAKEPLRRPQSPSELVDRLARLEIETFAERLSA